MVTVADAGPPVGLPAGAGAALAAPSTASRVMIERYNRVRHDGRPDGKYLQWRTF